VQSSLESAAYSLGQIIGGWLSWIILILVVKNFICALFCASLAGVKGYSALVYFFVGLIFGELALLYMVGMPLSHEEEERRQMQLAVVLADAGIVNHPEPVKPPEPEPPKSEPPKPIVTPLGDLDTSEFDEE
jgi:hypothetical protein